MSGRLGALLALSCIALVSCSSGGGEGAGANDAGASTDTGSPDATQPTVSQVVGASGGSVAATGLTLTIPQGALADSTTITVQNVGTAPQGYVGLSPMFQFGPDGTEFSQPVTVGFQISGGTNPAVFWSNAQGGFDELPTTTTSTTATAQVTHFSRGFCGESQHDGSDASGGSASGSSRSSSGGVSTSSGASSGSSGGLSSDDASLGVDSAPSSSGSSSSSGGSSGSSGSSSGVSSGSSSGGSSSSSSGGVADSGIADAASPDATTAPAIQATVDGAPTSFAYNVTVTSEQAWWLISADDAPAGAHWTLSLLTPTTVNNLACQNSVYPSINYRHYPSSDAGTPDMTFTSESSTGASCTIDELTAAMTAGSTAQGSFSAVLVLQGDAAAGSHTFSSGTYEVVVP